MSLIHDVIKIEYAKQGYLPNHPPHLISDNEMCEAFLSDSRRCYFKDNYPLITEVLRNEYNQLVEAIRNELDIFKQCNNDDKLLPDWIYSYMIGTVISVNSSKQEIHDLLAYLNVETQNDTFDVSVAASCYIISKSWLNKISDYEGVYDRPPTIFGEPLVIKSLRLAAASIQ